MTRRDMVTQQWERGWLDGLEAAEQNAKRVLMAARKNPIRGEPYWAGYGKALHLAHDHMRRLLRRGLQVRGKGALAEEQ